MSREFKEFNITEVATILGLKYVGPGPADESIYRCPFCGDSVKHPNKGHLYINTSSGQFRCHKCYEEGNAISLWAKYHGIDTKTAYRQLCEKIKAGPPPAPKIMDDQSSAELSTRHAVYSHMLKVLSLEHMHKADLLRRGLSESEIVRKGYRSIPQDPKSRWKITRYLTEKGFSLEGVPGFFTRNGRFGVFWDFVSPAGYLIPVRNQNQLIQAMQVRLDEGKYRWFSSYGLPNGTSSNAPAHYTGGEGTVWVTEGPLKADVASALMLTPFVGIPGVGAWREATDLLNSLRSKEIVVAFDADQKTNKEVQKALCAFIQNLEANGFKPMNCTWPDIYGKGIDDVMLKLAKEEITVVRFKIGGKLFELRREVKTTVSSL